jgi:hypothetical protein
LLGVFWRLVPRQKATFLLSLFSLCEKAAANARARKKPKRVSGLNPGGQEGGFGLSESF